MENVVLTVHLILALLLIGIVLLQRSEGGGLGMGGGGGATGGVMTGRQAANALSKLTWMLAAAFLVTSITLTVIAARNTSGASVLDQLDLGTQDSQQQQEGVIEGTGLTTAPPPGLGEPVAPPAADAPASATTPAEPVTDAAPVAPPATGDTTQGSASQSDAPVEETSSATAPAEEAGQAEPATEPGAAENTDAPATPPAAN